MLTRFEDQNIEWKRSWKDEYLKTICGFANAQGGSIYIGVDDEGEVVGVILEKDTSVRRYEKKLADEEELKQLLVAIPNKVQHALSLIVDVNLLSENSIHYIQIIVSRSAMPISYRGDYYYRSGSTTQPLTGSELTQFLFSRFGVQWDAAPVPGVSVEELDRESFDIFRREAVRSHRMEQEDLVMGYTELLDKLGLLTDGQLTRAAILLFHRNPERVSRGCRVRIAMFGEGSEILYQDEVKGSLFIIADRVVDLIYLKYLKAAIHYEKETRVETYPYPREAIREIIFNALIHSNWAANNDIQVRIDDNNIRISNCCILPSGWTLETLMGPHRSRAKNPSIAEVFKRAGYVETWGRGIEKIVESCRENGNPPPNYTLIGDDLTVHLVASERARIVVPARQLSLYEALGKRILAEIQRSGNMNPDSLASVLQLPPAVVRKTLLALIEGEANIAPNVDTLPRKVDNVDSKVDDSALKVDNVDSKVDDSALKVDHADSKVDDSALKVDHADSKVDDLMWAILEKIRVSPGITQIQLAVELQATLWKIKQSMNRLTQEGLLTRVGGRKLGTWKTLH